MLPVHCTQRFGLNTPWVGCNLEAATTNWLEPLRLLIESEAELAARLDVPLWQRSSLPALCHLLIPCVCVCVCLFAYQDE